jgi:hypothetical protein
MSDDGGDPALDQLVRGGDRLFGVAMVVDDDGHHPLAEHAARVVQRRKRELGALSCLCASPGHRTGKGCRDAEQNLSGHRTGEPDEHEGGGVQGLSGSSCNPSGRPTLRILAVPARAF